MLGEQPYIAASLLMSCEWLSLPQESALTMLKGNANSSWSVQFLHHGHVFSHRGQQQGLTC